MKLSKKIIVIAVSLILLITLDLITKNIAQAELQGQHPVTLLGGFIKLIYAENSGGMLSLFSTIPEYLKIIIFQVLVTLLLIFLLVYALYKKDLTKLQFAAFTLFLGGGIGNLIDRIVNDGVVIDFILLQAGGIHTGIFNVADMYVTSGVGLILLASYFEKRDEKRKIKSVLNSDGGDSNSDIK